MPLYSKSAVLKFALSGVVFSLFAASLASTVGCTRVSLQPLEIEPGEQGTFVAVGTDFGSEAAPEKAAPAGKKIATAHDDKQNPYDFVLLKSKTRGITIGTAATTPTPLSKNETATFIPASITKVVTAAIALKTLGPDFRFKTEVKWQNDDGETARELTIIADGDPTIDRKDSAFGHHARIAELAREMKTRGVNRVVGHISLISADERRDLAVPVEGIHQEDYTACYGAVSQSFNFHENCSPLVIEGMNEARWADENVHFPFKFDMVLGPKTILKTIAMFDLTGRIEGFLFQGEWGTKKPRPVWVSLPISDAKAWWGEALLSEFKEQGIDVSEVQLRYAHGAEARVLAGRMRSNQSVVGFDIYSEPAQDLIRFMNKPSNNFIADALFKAFAERHASRDSDLRKAGAVAMKEGIEAWMRRNGHPEYTKEIELIDGAGLSRINRTTPRAYLALLKEFSKEPSFAMLWDSLAIAGRDGTLKHRMRGTSAEDQVRGKTGTVRGAYQLAGYVPKLGSDGSIKAYVPFVILSAATEINRGRVRSFQDQLVTRLMDLVNPPASKRE